MKNTNSKEYYKSKIYTHIHQSRGFYRVANIHRIPYLYRSFSAKEPYN